MKATRIYESLIILNKVYDICKEYLTGGNNTLEAANMIADKLDLPIDESLFLLTFQNTWKRFASLEEAYDFHLRKISELAD